MSLMTVLSHYALVRKKPGNEQQQQQKIFKKIKERECFWMLLKRIKESWWERILKCQERVAEKK